MGQASSFPVEDYAVMSSEESLEHILAGVRNLGSKVPAEELGSSIVAGGPAEEIGCSMVAEQLLLFSSSMPGSGNNPFSYG